MSHRAEIVNGTLHSNISMTDDWSDSFSLLFLTESRASKAFQRYRNAINRIGNLTSHYCGWDIPMSSQTTQVEFIRLWAQYGELATEIFNLCIKSEVYPKETVGKLMLCAGIKDVKIGDFFFAVYDITLSEQSKKQLLLCKSALLKRLVKVSKWAYIWLSIIQKMLNRQKLVERYLFDVDVVNL